MDPARPRLAWYGLVALLAVVAYFYGLDSQHVPKNGDEYPYEHITRLTAQGGALLPLRSDLPSLRNTKPPLLFWQGIASTRWGEEWTLGRLRYPSVVYTLLTGALVLLLAGKLSGRLETGLLAALSFLAFFSTYRYGRPFLTNPPEVFWLFLPFFALLYWRPAAFESRLALPAALGVAVGIGALYKSFALVLPVTLALAWWHLHFRGYRLRAFLARDVGKVAVTASIALALFSTWLLLDPDPASVWREFVLRENLGKLDLPGGYLPRLLWGSSSLWSLALGYPLNAGLLALPVVALFLVAFGRRRELSDGERLLWLWVLTLFLVFSVPSQRSSRYLLPAMPALAVLLALSWQRIARWVMALALLATGAALAALAVLSLRLQDALPGLRPYPAGHWALLALAGALVLAALLIPSFTRAGVHAGVLLFYLSFASSLRPFDGPLGRYDPSVQQYARGRDVWVPNDFIAKDERFRFILPGARVHGFPEERGASVRELVARYPLVAVQRPLGAAGVEVGVVRGQRLDLRGRQTARELRQIVRGDVSPGLVVRELLVEAPGPGAAGAVAVAGAGSR
jgi:4-amino-4-deoxy-L-arabinose transferase-like glycosyltransferase